MTQSVKKFVFWHGRVREVMCRPYVGQAFAVEENLPMPRDMFVGLVFSGPSGPGEPRAYDKASECLMDQLKKKKGQFLEAMKEADALEEEEDRLKAKRRALEARIHGLRSDREELVSAMARALDHEDED